MTCVIHIMHGGYTGEGRVSNDGAFDQFAHILIPYPSSTIDRRDILSIAILSSEACPIERLLNSLLLAYFLEGVD